MIFDGCQLIIRDLDKYSVWNWYLIAESKIKDLYTRFSSFQQFRTASFNSIG